jgi:hypothetical protein
LEGYMRNYAAYCCCILLLSLTVLAENVLAAGQQVPDMAVIQKAAEQGDAKAQYNLGLSYASGQGVPKDEAKAAQWFQKAAVQGYAEAQYILGLSHAKGHGVPQDETRAVQWYQKAAEQGHVGAQNILGLIYAKGQGVLKDETVAAQWFQKAAAQGNASAQFTLAMMYAKGQGVPQDEAMAAQWFLMYANGRFVPKGELLNKICASRNTVPAEQAPVLRPPPMSTAPAPEPHQAAHTSATPDAAPAPSAPLSSTATAYPPLVPTADGKPKIAAHRVRLENGMVELALQVLAPGKAIEAVRIDNVDGLSSLWRSDGKDKTGILSVQRDGKILSSGTQAMNFATGNAEVLLSLSLKDNGAFAGKVKEFRVTVFFADGGRAMCLLTAQ